MVSTRKSFVAAAIFSILLLFSLVPHSLAQAAASPAAARAIGVIKSVAGNNLVVTTDAGQELTVLVVETTRLQRMAPGQQDLTAATPITLQDLQAGDRVAVRGSFGEDGKTVTAKSVIAMKQADIAEKQKKDLQDWQRRGVGGLVKSVDATAGTITISAMSATGTTSVTVRTSKNTTIRRYSPDSVKFDDAKPGTLADIKPGDQLRARGQKNPEGTELAAEEIVSGTFRNIAGLITSVDPSKQTVTVNDLATKKPIVVRITGESQMHKLPPFVAQRFAMRLKGQTPESASAPTQGARDGERPQAPQGGEQGRPQMGGPGGPGGMRGNGAADLQQLFARLPQMNFSELAKGDALMIVTTSGSTTSDATAITLLSGVEPILTANGSGAASLLTPWNLGANGAEQGAQ